MHTGSDHSTRRNIPTTVIGGDAPHNGRSSLQSLRQEIADPQSFDVSILPPRKIGRVQHADYQVPARVDDPEIGAAPHCNPLVKSKSTLIAPAIISNAKTPVARNHSNKMGC
jgi:hypothetical protein